jgi:hypothetical protein
MKAFLPSDELLFLLRLSVEPMRERLGPVAMLFSSFLTPLARQ